MVVVKIMQGLGNQMFQYAAARALSLHLNEPLKVNIDNYGPDSLRQYELKSFFEIKTPTVTEDEMQLFNLNHPVRRFWNKVFKSKKIRALPYEEKSIVRLIYSINYFFRPAHKQNVFEEKQFHYDKNFFDTSTNVFLKGYWMSYKYFEKYSDTIKNDFTIKRDLIKHFDAIALEMQATESIALHIRCGDKLLPQYINLMGILPSTYYENAINHIMEQKGTPVKIYVFTDSVTEVKKYLPININYTIVSEFTKKSIEDFYLMTQCRNIVMSNSTFSWWAAYLNNHSNKIVVIPKKWYNNASYNAKDLYCPDWIRL